MDTGKLTTKGQVTIPKAVREHLGVGPSDKVAFTLLDDGRAVISAADRPASTVFGILAHRPRTHAGPLTVAEMEEVIQRARHSS